MRVLAGHGSLNIPLVWDWLQAHASAELGVAAVSVLVAVAAWRSARSQAKAAKAQVRISEAQVRVSEAAVDEARQANEATRRQFDLSHRQILEAATPIVDIIVHSIDGPIVSGTSIDGTQKTAADSPFHPVNDFSVEIGYHVTCTIMNGGSTRVVFQDPGLEFIDDPDEGICKPGHTSTGLEMYLAAGAAARFAWKPSLHLERWMHRYAFIDENYSVVTLSTFMKDEMRIASELLQESIKFRTGGGSLHPTLKYSLRLVAEAVVPQRPTYLHGRVERTEVREEGVTNFVWALRNRRADVHPDREVEGLPPHW